MLKFPKARTIEEKLLFVYGFLGTMPIIQLFGFTAFTWLTLLMLGYVVFKGQHVLKINRQSIPYIVFTCLTILSSILCLTSDMDAMWKKSQIPNMVWQICYLFLFLYYFRPGKFETSLLYIKGVYYAAFAHAVWGIFQFLIYEVAHVSINRLLFFDLMHVEMADYVQMRGSSIAMTGFCWNAGNLAPLLVIGYVFSGSLTVKLFFIAVTFLSGSRTGITGIIACAGLEICFRLFSRYRKRIKPVHVIGVLVLLAAGAAFVVTNGKMMQKITARLGEMREMFSPEFLNTQSSSRLHARYWISVPRITEWNGLINNLFGYGNGSSGYPLAQLYNQYADHAWTVECDFINTLWSFGYVGFLVWYGWYLYFLKKGRKLDKKYLLLFAGFLVEGVSYNITFNWCLMFLLFVFTHINYSSNFLNKDYLITRGIMENASL